MYIKQEEEKTVKRKEDSWTLHRHGPERHKCFQAGKGKDTCILCLLFRDEEEENRQHEEKKTGMGLDNENIGRQKAVWRGVYDIWLALLKTSKQTSCVEKANLLWASEAMTGKSKEGHLNGQNHIFCIKTRIYENLEIITTKQYV